MGADLGTHWTTRVEVSESAWEISERFYTGCELWEAGNTLEAFAVF
jgi:hypothetical protein